MIGAIVGGLVGYKLGKTYLAPRGETLISIGYLNRDPSRPVLLITQVSYRGTLHYRLYAMKADDTPVQVAAAWEYGGIIAPLSARRRPSNGPSARPSVSNLVVVASTEAAHSHQWVTLGRRAPIKLSSATD